MAWPAPDMRLTVALMMPNGPRPRNVAVVLADGTGRAARTSGSLGGERG